MADAINLSDVSTKDDSKLKTGGRRSYKMAIHKGGCPSGEHLVKGKCIPRKKSKLKKGQPPRRNPMKMELPKDAVPKKKSKSTKAGY